MADPKSKRRAPEELANKSCEDNQNVERPTKSAKTEKRVILVTGASRGIGRTIAQKFAEDGATIAIHYNSDIASAEDTRESLAHSSTHKIFKADLGKPEECAKLVREVTEEFGRIDVLVANAGINILTKFEDTSFTEWCASWKETLAVNLEGPAHLGFLVGKHFISQNCGGSMVFIGSRGGFRGEPDMPAYGASKLGLHSLVGSLAQALGKHRIRVNAVAPGFVETDMAAKVFATLPRLGDEIREQSCWNRVATVDEVAAVAKFLASPEATWTTGAIVDCNGASYLRA